MDITVFTQLNATFSLMLQMDAKLPLNAAPFIQAMLQSQLDILNQKQILLRVTVRLLIMQRRILHYSSWTQITKGTVTLKLIVVSDLRNMILK